MSTQIDLSFLNQNKELAFSIAQLQAMDKELQDIARQAPELIALANAFGLTYAAASKLTKELQLAPAQLKQAVGTMGSLKAVGADAVTQYAVLSKELGLSAEQMRLLTDEVEALGGKQPVVESLTAAMAQLFILDKVNAFKGAVLETGKVFETLNTRLKTTLGTQAGADEALGRIQKFAAETPFELVEVTDTFVKLKQRGIDPTNDALRSLGDIAASQGKSLNQTTEALLDAGQGEFERLKEFGIKASAAGDKVNLSFQGVNKQIDRTPEAITAGVLALGKLDGVAGGMAEQAKTLGGSLSNLKDGQDKLAASAFKLVQPFAVELVQGATALIDSFFKLNPAIQQIVLGTAVLGTALVSAVVALAAFKSAAVGAALASLQAAAASIPAGIAATAETVAKVANTVATKLATLAELELTGAKTAGTGATVASTAATAARTAVQSAATAVTSAGAKAMAFAASTAGLMAGAVLGTVASLAVLVETFQNVTQGEREAAKVTDDVLESFKALDAATEKRVASAKAAQDAESKGAEAARRNSLTAKQLAQENAAAEAKYAENYAKSVDGRLSIIQKVLDKVREFINLPASALSKTFEIVAKLPAPQFVKDFFQGVSDAFAGLKLKLAKEALIDSDTIGLGKQVQDNVDGIGRKLQDLKKSAGGNLTGASKAEVEALSGGYDKQIVALEKLTVANSGQALSRDLAIRQLKKEKEEVDQSLKLIQEREKRVASMGTAEVQWAAEVKKVTENLNKQIATTEDAQKQIDLTKKQLENGFIDSDTAKKQFEQVANYTSAAGDAQVAAAKELQAIRQKETDLRKTELEAEIVQVELQGVQEVKSKQDVAAEVAAIRAKQSQLEVESIKAVLIAEQNAGRTRGDVYRKAQVDLKKALGEQAKSQAEAQVAERAAAEAKITKALEDAAGKRAEVESKSAIGGKQAVLDALKTGNKSIEDAEQESDKKTAETKKQSLAEEIEQKKAAQQQLLAIGGEEATKKAEALGREVLKLQEQQLGVEIDLVKKAQAAKLKIIKDAIDKRKALVSRDAAEGELSVSTKELALVKGKEASKADVQEKAAELRLANQQKQLKAEEQIAVSNLEQIRQAVATNVLDKKEGDKQIVQLETELAQKRTAVVGAQIQQQEQLEAKRLRMLQDAQDKRRALAEKEQSAGQERAAKDNLELVKANQLDKSEIDRLGAEASAKLKQQELATGRKLLEQELADIRKAVADKVINRKDGNKQILKLETELSKQRASIAQAEAEQIQAARERERQAIAESAKQINDAAASAQQAATAQSEAELSKLRLDNAAATGEKLESLDRRIATKRQALSVATAQVAFDSAQAELGVVAKQRERGLLSVKEGQLQELAATARLQQAKAALVSTQADFEVLKAKQALDAKLELMAKERQTRELNANKAIKLIQDEQQAISQTQQLLQAEERLFGAKSAAMKLNASLATQELEIARDMASAQGNEAAAADYSVQIKKAEVAALQAQRSEIEAQFEFKQRSLALDIQSKELANEQLLIEKQLAALDAESAVKAAELQGKSAEEVELLKQKADFANKAVDLAGQAADNQTKIADMQREALALERATALNANSGQVRKAQAGVDIEAARSSKQSAQSDGGRQQDFGESRTVENSGVTTASATLTSFAPAVQGAEEAASALKGSLGDATTAVNAFAAAAKDAKPAGKPTFELAGKRADGGPVAAGGTYLVGERGPELVTFPASGRVVSNEQSAAMLSKMAKAFNLSAPATTKAAVLPGNSDLLAQLKQLNEAVRSKRSMPVNVPVTVQATSMDGAAEALQLVRADRAMQARALFS